MLSRNVQLFSRKQMISVVTCIPCEPDSFWKGSSNCCEWQRSRSSTTKSSCPSKNTPTISAVKIPFAFPRAATLFTQSPGCSLDPISFGLSNRLPYHVQTRSFLSLVSKSANIFDVNDENKLCRHFQHIGHRHSHRNRFWFVGQFCTFINIKFDLNVNVRCKYTSSKHTDNVQNKQFKENTGTQDNISLDNESKLWLEEVRNDFKIGGGQDNEGGDKSVENSSKNDETSSDSGYNSDSSSQGSESSSGSDSSSDSELEDHVIQEVLDHAEFYAEDGHENKLKKSSPTEKKSTNIEEEAVHYSEVSKYAERITETGTDNSVLPETEDLTITIEEFSDYESDWEEEKPAYIPPIPLTRGKDGVFDLHDLMTFLRAEQARDICVIDVADDCQYVDHFVIITATSPRHTTALAESIQWIHKRRKNSTDPVVHIEKGQNWTALDLGNIAVHVMTAEVRETYDIETLWTCGAEFDEKSRETEFDPYAYSMESVQQIKSSSEIVIPKE